MLDKQNQITVRKQSVADPGNTKELGPIGGRGGGRGVWDAVGEGESHMDAPMTMRFFSVFKYFIQECSLH